MENFVSPVNKTFRIKNTAISFSSNSPTKGGFSPTHKLQEPSGQFNFEIKANGQPPRNQTPKMMAMPTIKTPTAVTSYQLGSSQNRKTAVKASLQLDNVSEFTIPKGGKIAQSVKNSASNPIGAQTPNKTSISLEPGSLKRPAHVKATSIGLTPTIRTSVISANKANRPQMIFPQQTTIANNATLDMLIANFIPNTIPPFDPPRTSSKKNGCIVAYAANTHQGIIRNYNEDRVSIIMNINRMHKYGNGESKGNGGRFGGKEINASNTMTNGTSLGTSNEAEKWPRCAFFAVYDGHGGSLCCDFLRDHLHDFVIRDPAFPSNPKEALKNGFAIAERRFTELAQQGVEVDRSGSCALVVLIVDDMCYVANVGDSRGIMSVNGGQRVVVLTRDHKPQDEDEQKRIYAAGGEVYQGQIPLVGGLESYFAGGMTLMGPYRVLPGRLSVSRTFGDIEAKIPKYGGNPNVVIPEPEIRSFKITEDMDFIALASDGVYDKLSNNEMINLVWRQSATPKTQVVHQHLAHCVDLVMRESLIKKTLDNISVLIIGFKNFAANVYKENPKGNLSTDEEESSPSPKLRASKEGTQLPQITGSLLNSTGGPNQPFQSMAGQVRQPSPTKNGEISAEEVIKKPTPKPQRQTVTNDTGNNEGFLDEMDDRRNRETPTGMPVDLGDDQLINKISLDRTKKVPSAYTPATSTSVGRANRSRRPFSRKEKNMSVQRDAYSTLGSISKTYKPPSENNISVGAYHFVGLKGVSKGSNNPGGDNGNN